MIVQTNFFQYYKGDCMKMIIVALLFCVVSVTMVTADVCPFGWSEFGGHCYYFSAKDDKRTWHDALKQCERMGGHFVSIESTKESDYINTRKKSISSDVWLGGTDEKSEGKWMWSATREYFTVTNWGPSEPNGGKTTNCMLISSNQKWYDVTCKSRCQYICEKNPKQLHGDDCLSAKELLEELVKCRKRC